MRKQLLRSRTFRFVARVLVAAQVVTAIPALAKAEPVPTPPQVTTVDHPPDSTPPPPPPQVTVNRTVPHVDPAPPYAPFGQSPTAEDITNARVFGEPLVPLGGAPSEEENQALANAIQAFQSGGNVEDVTPYGEFLVEHTGTPWRASLLMNLGVLYRRTGHFTNAVDVLRRAWDLAKSGQDDASDATASRAMGELLSIATMFGQVDALAALIAEVGDRQLLGDAENRYRTAKYTMWVLQNQHSLACPSGPVALDKIRGALHMPGPERHPESLAFPATHDGANLLQMAELSQRMGLHMRMAQRTPGAPIPLPAMVHFKQKHFSAITRFENGRYLLSDPFLGGEFWISPAALDEEASGSFLLLDQPLPEGWRPATGAEAAAARGKCGLPLTAENYTSPCGPLVGDGAGGGSGGSSSSSGSTGGMSGGSCTSGSCGGGGSGSGGNCGRLCGMATYSFHSLLANLHITDTPVGYSPPRGPAVRFRVSYNFRESYQPTTFTFSNFGPKWVFGWMAYIEDNPSAPGGTVTLHTANGGSSTYLGVTGSGSNPETLTRSQLVLVSTSPLPVRYERRAADGSVQVYAQEDGAMTMPRRIFMTQEIDPQGNAVTYTYDTQLRLVSVTDAIGQVSTVSYEMSGDPLKITKVTDPFGRFAKFEYNSDGMLWRITDVIGIQSSFEYGNGTWIHALTTPYGTTLFGFDTDHYYTFFAVTATDPLGGTEKIYYGTGTIPATEPASVLPTGFTNNASLNTNATFYWDKRAQMLYPGDFSKAHTMKWRQDTTNNTIAPVLASEKKPLENRVWYEHTGGATANSVGASGRPAKIGRVLDDGSSQIYKYEYNSNGNKTRETDPLGRTTILNYFPNGMDLQEVRQVNGQSTDLLASFTYDSQHQPLTTDAAGQTITYTYNAQGQRLTATTPPRDGISENRTTTYSYDTNGYLQSVTGPATGATTSYTYDGYGRRRTVTDSEAYVLTTDYDALDRQTKLTYPDGTYEQTVYNRLDAQDQRDRLGRWAHTFYDALRRPISMRDAANRTTTQQWCACGSLDKIVDANNNATTWERDVQGRVTKEARADGGQWLWTYETTTSRLKTRTDPKTQAATYSYLRDNTLSQTVYTNTAIPTATVSFTYDLAYKRVSSMTDGTGTTNYTYYPISVPPVLGAGQLQTVDGPLTNDAVSYSYDELGRVITRGLPAFSTTSGYDALGRLASLGSPVGTFNWSYVNTTGRPQSVSYPNGQVTTYTYFGNLGDERLQEIKHQQSSGGAVLSQFDYTYDPLGNISSWQQRLGASPAKVYLFGYDAADQISSAVQKDVSTQQVLKNYGYFYDPAGNKTVDAQDSTATTSQYNNRNELTQQAAGAALPVAGGVSEPATVSVSGTAASVNAANQFTGSAQLGTGTQSFTVVATDPSGNARTNTYQVNVSGTAQTFVYDASGNLCAKGGTTCANGTTTYDWDAEDRLVAVKQGGTTLASFVYDGKGRRFQKIAGGVTHTYVYDRQNIIEETLSSGQTYDYVQGPGTDRPLAQRDQASVVSYYLADHLGSIAQTTSSAGAVTLTREYDPWGNLLQGTSAAGYAFTGREWDPEIGAYYYRARYYDPRIGRFISEDPIALKSGDGTNLLAYVANNPLSRIDPLGLAACREDCLKETADIYAACRARAQKQYDEDIDRIKKYCWGMMYVLDIRCWQSTEGNYYQEAKGNYYANLSACRKERLENEKTCKALPPCGSSGGGGC